MLKKVFSIVMACMALISAAMPMTAQAYQLEFEDTQCERRAGAKLDDIYHSHEGDCYVEDWIETSFTYNPVLNQHECIKYVLTTEHEYLRFVVRENAVISVYRLPSIPLEVYLNLRPMEES